MLLELKVNHFAIIENLHLQFGSGLNILSGETGAGKSILLKGLGLLMGEKSSADTIRSGHDTASIEGSFDLKHRLDIQSRLQDLGIECEDQLLVVKRVISEDKSKVYLNGSLATLSTLREVVAPLVEVTGHTPLIEMTGQHDNRNLLSSSYHLELLDQYCGLMGAKQKYQELYHQWNSLAEEKKMLLTALPHKEQRLDFLNFQKNEMTQLDLAPGEEITLEQNIKKSRSASRILQFVESAENSLIEEEDSAIAKINRVVQSSHEFNQMDSAVDTSMNDLKAAKSTIEDAIFNLRKSLDSVELDSQELERQEARLSQIRKLQKKYGPSTEDILKALVEIENEILQIQNTEKRLNEIEKESEQLLQTLWKMAKDLHKRRTAGGELLSDSVNAELADLNMKGVQLLVAMQLSPDLLSTGSSVVEFQIKNSPKDTPRPLAKTASGGELSRILLSLKRVVGSHHLPRTYLFDEVDTGVSGPTAEKVGRKLKSTAKGQQVICVTHLPQVAACGDYHYYIHKTSQKGNVSMQVSELKKKDRIQELARLISGEKVTKSSLTHAETLLNEAQAAF